jgi:uncharacterized protein with beta-barrel porin domain
MDGASTYVMAIGNNTSSRTNVTGTANLGGSTLDVTFAPSATISKQYTILNSTGVLGTHFGAKVDTGLPAGFTDSVSYDAHDAFLNFALNFPTSGLNRNQQAVASAVTNFFNAGGSLPVVFGGLTPAGLSQASGETATGTQQTTFNAMNLFMGIMSDPFIAGRGNGTAASQGATGYADDEALGYTAKRNSRDAFAALYTKAPIAKNPALGWSTWAASYGGSQKTDGNAALGSNITTSKVFGVAAGADYRFSPDTIAGFALGGGGTNFAVNGFGSGRSDLFQAGAFVRHEAGQAYVTAALAYGWQDITTNRTVTIAGTDQLRARFNANAWSGRIESGYRMIAPVLGGVGITPYVAGQLTTFDLPSYAESVVSGANTFALTYGSQSVTATRTELGARADKSYVMNSGVFTVRGRAAWAHDYNADRNIAATFQALPGATFVVNGARQPSDLALTTASAEWKWLSGVSVAGTFEGEFSPISQSYAGKGVVRYAW